LSLEQLPSNQVRAYYYTTSAQYFDSTATLNLNAWNHIAYTWNPSGSTLYINGVKDSTSNLTWANVASGSLNQTVDLGYNYATGDGFVGSMDEVRISNHTRSAAEIYNDYNGGAVVTSNISSLSPSTGAVAGGTAVNLNGTFLPPNSANAGAWTSLADLPVNLMSSKPVIIGNNIYLFGGNVNGTIGNSIYSAPLSDPNNWTNVGSISPVTSGIAYANLVQLGNNLYIFGGENSAGASINNIYCASISSPTTWFAANNASAPCYDSGGSGTLPTVAGDSQIITIGSSLFLLGGFNGTSSVNTIWTSTIGNPTRWSTSTKILPDSIASAQSAVIGNYVYIFGYNNYNAGHHVSANIYRAPVTNFLGTSAITWTNVGTMPAALADAQLVIVGDTMYMIGGFTGSGFSNTVYSAPLPDPINPAATISWSTATTLPGTLAYSSAAVIDNYIYLFGGYNGGYLRNIYRSPLLNHYRSNFYNRPWTTNWSSMSPQLYDQSSISFGGTAGSSPTYSTTSATVNTPAHFGGKVDVTVTKLEGTTTTYNNGFSFGTPAVSSLSVTSGPAGGGTPITITGTGFTPANSFTPPSTTDTWTTNSRTLSTGVGYGATAIIGTNAYIYGGFNGTAPISNIQKIDLTCFPAATCNGINSVTDTGKSIPSGLEAANIAVIGNYVYIFGGHISGAWPGVLSNKIYRAPVSDPTTWTDVTALNGKTLPATNAASQLAVIGNNIYIFGGYTTTGTTGPTNAIYTASVSDPTTWTTVTGTLPNTLYNHSVLVIKNKAYLMGGYLGETATNKVFLASCSGTVCSVSDTGNTLPSTNTSASVTIMGNNAYSFGGYTGSAGLNKIYTAPVVGTNGLGPWSDTGKTLDTVLWNPSANLLINGYIYLVGGYNGSSYTNIIRNAPLTQNRPNLFAPSWTTNWPTASTDQSNVTIGGVSASNVNVVSSTSITAITGSGTGGIKDVVVTNTDGTSATLSNGFTYSGPTISSVSPTSGTASGGTSVTLTGTNYLLPNSGGATGWASIGNLPANLMAPKSLVIGDYIYLFGGFNGTKTVNTIYSAPVSNPPAGLL
jgi:N-acetylneuraminic acid mutarotase